MRTTIDIDEPLLRQAKAKAALEGKKLKDVVNEALEELLLSKPISDEPSLRLPPNARLDDIGRYRIPVLQSPRPGKTRVSPKALKDLELNEDAARYGKSK